MIAFTKKTLIASFLLLGISFGATPAHAQLVVSAPVLEAIKAKETVEVSANLATNIVSTAKAVEEYIREYVLDGLAWQLANVALEQMTQDIVAYINSGFNGSPAFLQDPEAFFLGIADDVAGDFLQEIGGGFLCSPFQTDIQFALEIGYYQSGGRTDLQDRYACTLSDALGNIEDFLENDLSQGGLDQFFNIAVRPENNPYVLTVDLQRELQGRIFGEQQGERQILEWNGGFLSRRECLPGQEEPKCTGDILTPGDTIQNQLNESLGIGRDRLVVADDINEIIGALMNQLVSQAIGGAGGLLGLSTSGGGSSSYFDRTNNPGVGAGDRDQLEDQLQDGITDGNRADQILERIITDALQANQILATAQSSTVCSPDQISKIQTLVNQTLTYRSEAIVFQNETEDGVQRLRQLLGDLQASNSRAEYLAVLEEYQRLVRAEAVPTGESVVQARTLEAQIESSLTEAQTALNNCGS
ncbi:MAG: hypothetical protein ACJKSS_00685 [Patescibacteria group bacterium UBA2103]